MAMFPFSFRPHTTHTTEQKQNSFDNAHIDLGTLAGEAIFGIFLVEICRTCLVNEPMHQNFKLRALYLSMNKAKRTNIKDCATWS